MADKVRQRLFREKILRATILGVDEFQALTDALAYAEECDKKEVDKCLKMLSKIHITMQDMVKKS